MKYAVEMGSGAMMYIPSFIKIGSGIRKLIGRYTDTQTEWRSQIPVYCENQTKHTNTLCGQNVQFIFYVKAGGTYRKL
jgi:hypothetical protein